MMIKSKSQAVVMLTTAFFSTVLFSFASRVQAQVDVVELDIPSTRMGSSGQVRPSNDIQGARNGGVTSGDMTDFYFQLQTLQQEVQSLRGIVEEQRHALKKLKQQRLDDYLDLDRRVSQLSKQAPAGASNLNTLSALPQAVAVQKTDSTNAASVVDSSVGGGQQGDKPNELETYRAGINAVLKQKNYATGIDQFKRYLSFYPNGLYAANSKYWLGQVYLQQNELDLSQQWFGDLIAQHPNHQKTAEAQFKLGKVLHLQGDMAAAQKQLEVAASLDARSAGLAKEYLNTHFK